MSGAALISVIVTTYNREDALDAALRALAHQSDRNFEIVIADDGSRPDTARVIESWQARLPLPLKHVRHEHRGFRGGEIRNRGIRASAGEICIFLDGDCLAAADFIAAYRRLYEPGWFVTGNRILLSPELTAAVLAGGLEAERWNFAALLRAAAARRHQPFVADPAAAARAVAQAPARKLGRRANLQSRGGARATSIASTASTALIPAGALEDSDLVVRLLHAGVRRKDGRFATGVLHLWHPPNDRSQFPANQARLDEVIGGSRVRALRGLSVLSDAVALPRDSASVASAMKPIALPGCPPGAGRGAAAAWRCAADHSAYSQRQAGVPASFDRCLGICRHRRNFDRQSRCCKSPHALAAPARRRNADADAAPVQALRSCSVDADRRPADILWLPWPGGKAPVRSKRTAPGLPSSASRLAALP